MDELARLIGLGEWDRTRGIVGVRFELEVGIAPDERFGVIAVEPLMDVEGSVKLLDISTPLAASAFSDVTPAG